jgi:radical SAM protein with 4Fe4S-binding SPASM domain
MKLKYLLKEAKYYKRLGKGHLKRMVVKFSLAKTPLSKIVNTKVYNSAYYSSIKKKSNKIKPSVFQIETTSFCNARCTMCPHVYMKRKQKSMNQEDFIKICNNVLKYEKIELIVLSGFGEPFIDREILKKIKWLNENYPKLKIDLYTNASLLMPKLSDEILKLKIHKINFSINGTENSYKNIMALDYQKTKSNILYFIKKKKDLKLDYPLTNISLMIIKENKEEIDQIINFWLDKTDSVMAYLPSDWAGKLKSVSGVNQVPFKDKRWPCKVLWTNITVDVEGNVIMCCRDYESRIKFGNLLKKNINEIRDSREFKSLLKNQLEMNFKTPICDGCNNSFDSSMDWLSD